MIREGREYTGGEDERGGVTKYRREFVLWCLMISRVQGMVEVAGLEEDEIIQEAYESDLVSAKTAVSISLGRTEEYEHCAKREKDKVERDRSQRQECVRGLTSLGQRCVF